MSNQDTIDALELATTAVKAGMTNRIIEAMLVGEVTLKDLIDGIIERDSIIGVGLITLRDQLNEIVNIHLQK